MPITSDWTESFQYDDQGRQTLATSFEGVVTQSVYDDLTGRLTEQRFFDNSQQFNNGQGTPSQTVVYQYDAFGRRVAAIRHDGDDNGTVVRDERWVYDQQGNLIATITPEGVIGYGYDTLGRQIRTVTAAAAASVADRESLASALTLNPQLSTLDVLSDIRQTYDALGRLATITVWARNGVTIDPAQRPTAKYSYDLQGKLSRVDLPNDVIATYQYDVLGRLTRLTHYKPDATPNDLSDNAKLDDFQYTLRTDGRWVQVDEQIWVNLDAPQSFHTTYDYDTDDRLVTEDHQGPDGDYTDRYSFDLAGNRLTKTTDNGRNGKIDQTTNYAYDANDRLQTESASDSYTVYGYDHTEQTAKSVYTDSSLGTLVSSTTFAYDVRGRMVQAVTEDANGVPTVAAYRYDDAGTCTAMVISGSTTTTYLVDYRNPTGYSQTLEETTRDNLSGDVLKRISYTVGLDQISQTTVDADHPTGQTLVFQTDGHGSVRVLTDLAAAVVQAFAYDAYGQLLAIWNSQNQLITGGNHTLANAALASTSYLYNSEAFDPQLGLQYLRARWYNPAVGQFTTLDPVFGYPQSPWTLNKYAYTHGDPANFGDTSGMTEGGLNGLMGNITGITVLQAVKAGAIFGAAYGGGRALVDTLTDPDATWEDVVYKTAYATFWGAIYGGAFGLLGVGALAMGPVAVGVFAVATTGLALWNDGVGVYDSFSQGKNLQGAARSVFLVVDSLLGYAAIQGAASGSPGGQRGALGGKIVDSVSYRVIQSLLSPLGIRLKAIPVDEPVSSSNPSAGAVYRRYKDPADNTRTFYREIRHHEGELTWYMLMHEIGHAVQEAWLGDKGYHQTEELGREQFALQFLRRFYWSFMNAAEKEHAENYVSNFTGNGT